MSCSAYLQSPVQILSDASKPNACKKVDNKPQVLGIVPWKHGFRIEPLLQQPKSHATFSANSWSLCTKILGEEVVASSVKQMCPKTSQGRASSASKCAKNYTALRSSPVSSW
ncbi:hypothetical protein TIFTF001_040645 [Ficus carica]|uniref:Uncharacterized protein n=1 Tax=Ficus carica TaxID=3494 RepID=A0AA87YWZ7_FICCA|nr:hypothetical protein TIFTF001_040645 [Ficus carica]